VSRRRFEIRTLFVALVIHAGWLALTFEARTLPVVVVVPLAGLLLAWHGSLQHEAVHGHPTRWTLVNSLIAGAPLSLWLPLPIYRATHLAHHRSDLTNPIDDPESYYVTDADWARMGVGARALHLALNTLAGRLVLGPIVMIARLYAIEARRIVAGDAQRLGIWLAHAIACALVLSWVVGVCGIPVWLYLVGFVYPGLAMTLLRSYVEHKPDPEGARRSVIVEAGPVLSLIFLHNNLHAVHHRLPGLPWYELPGRWRALREEILVDNGGYRYRGYGEIARRFALRVKDSPLHPGGH
jgi:fatty acid desaturase